MGSGIRIEVICTTGWAAAEFERIGADNVVRVPLGVDLATFTPRAIGSGRVRAPGQILLVHCGRLSAEKKPQRSLTTLATMRRVWRGRCRPCTRTG